MQLYELTDIMDLLNYSTKQEWEQTRFSSYITAQVNSTKRLKPEDVIKFEWDKNTNSESVNTITESEIKRLKEKSELMKKYL